MKFLLKSSITNSINSHTINNYRIFETEYEISFYKQIKEEEIRIWNYETPDVVSIREISFIIYQEDEFRNIPIDELNSCPLWILKILLENKNV